MLQLRNTWGLLMDPSRTERLRILIDRLTSTLEPWMGSTATDNEKPITPKMVEIIARLQGNLLLVEPTLNWVKQKEAELAGAQLGVLYTPEELEALRERVSK